MGTEECDDGDTVSDDGCSSTCTVECGYTCSTAEPNVCSTTCGDAILAGNEACDDGNSVSGDGCSGDCLAVQVGYSCTSSGCGLSTCAPTSSPNPPPPPTSPCEAVEKVVEVYVPWYTYHLSQLNNTWGSPEFAHCELNFTFRELRNRYKESRPPNFKTGGLGPLMQPGRYEVWLCVEDHYCSIHPTDKFFCWVLDETKVKSVGEVAPDQWVPWNHHAHLQLVH